MTHLPFSWTIAANLLVCMCSGVTGSLVKYLLMRLTQKCPLNSAHAAQRVVLSPNWHQQKLVTRISHSLTNLHPFCLASCLLPSSCCCSSCYSNRVPSLSLSPSNTPFEGHHSCFLFTQHESLPLSQPDKPRRLILQCPTVQLLCSLFIAKSTII